MDECKPLVGAEEGRLPGSRPGEAGGGSGTGGSAGGPGADRGGEGGVKHEHVDQPSFTTVGRCRSTVSKPVLKPPMVSALDTIIS